jgi:hypothetical protein
MRSPPLRYRQWEKLLCAQSTRIRLRGKPMIELLSRPSLLASELGTLELLEGTPLPGVQALSR